MSILIVGAGVAGLTIGERLVKRGKRVVIVEREKCVGGLARSFHYEDGSNFDMGPHRFYTDDPGVSAYLHDILGDNILEIDRASGVYLCKEYFDWPLRLREVLRLPWWMLGSSLLDLLPGRRPRDDHSFKSYIVRKYGKTLYNNFFENYTLKFLRFSPSQLHEHWASASINRAVIDKKLTKRTSNLFNLAIGLIFPTPVKTKFIYPRNGTIDVFPNSLAKIIQDHGSEIITGVGVDKFECSSSLISRAKLSNGEILDCDQVVWTASVSNLIQMLYKQKPDLNFLSTVFYNLRVYGPPKKPYQWCYFGEPSVIFSRVACMNWFNPSSVPEGSSALAVEVPCYIGDMIWEHPEKFLNLIVLHLINTGYLHNFNEVISVNIEKVRETYPVYQLGYDRILKDVIGEIEKYENLYPLGRCGTFWYNNMDHSIRAALDLEEMIMKGGRFTFSLPGNL